jgi:hypothetical protein
VHWNKTPDQIASDSKRRIERVVQSNLQKKQSRRAQLVAKLRENWQC